MCTTHRLIFKQINFIPSLLYPVYFLHINSELSCQKVKIDYILTDPSFGFFQLIQYSIISVNIWAIIQTLIKTRRSKNRSQRLFSYYRIKNKHY